MVPLTVLQGHLSELRKRGEFDEGRVRGALEESHYLASLIRNLAAAARMLGRPYSITGRVIEGRRLGRELGFPTANLPQGEEQYPPDGVWAVRVALEGGEGKIPRTVVEAKRLMRSRVAPLTWRGFHSFLCSISLLLGLCVANGTPWDWG